MVVPAAIIALPALIAALLAGCSPPGSTPSPSPAQTPLASAGLDASPATRLAVLARGVGGGELVIVDDSAQVALLPVPTDAIAWISTSAAGRLLATTADGRLLVAPPPSTGEEPWAWREIVPTYAGAAPAGPLSFGTLSPDGLRVVAVAADFAAGTAFDLALVATDGGDAAMLHVAAPPDGAAPAWLPDGRLLLIARAPERDATGIILVDPARPGSAARLEHEAYGIAVSADGRVAAIARTDGRVVVGAPHLLLGALLGAGGRDPGNGGGRAGGRDPGNGGGRAGGRDPAGALVDGPPGTAPGSFALDPSGTRLAISWLDDAGGVATVWRYRLGPDGPAAEGPVATPGGGLTAIVAWLP
jgi:hypothetical protein